MKIRRFYAANSRDALRQVREALGPDAIILSNRQVDGGVEIITAVDFDEEGLMRAEETAQAMARAQDGEARPDMASRAATEESKAAPALAPSFMQQLKTAVSARGSGEQKPIRETPPVKDVMPAKEARPVREVEPAKEARPQPVMRPAISTYDELSRAPLDEESETRTTIAALQSELKEMRVMMETRLMKEDKGETTPAPTPPPALRNPANVLMPLIRLGFGTRTARHIMTDVPETVRNEDTRAILKAHFLKEMPVADEDFEEGGVLALLGPTGVGKTTTLAKLAARFSLKYGASQVALLTTDTYRIAGSEQLRVYGRILGIPVEVVHDANALQERLDALSHKKLILIDTVGFSPKDERLQEQLRTLTQIRQRILKVLVVNAAAGRAHQQLVIKTYGSQGLDACIVSKVDEAPKLGEAVDMLLQHRIPLTFYTNGQRVPEDMHRLDIEGVMELLFPKESTINYDADMESPEAWAAHGQALRQAGYPF